MRLSVGNVKVAEALAVTPHEVVLNGKARGETTLIIWQQDGKRLMFDLSVRPNTSKVDAINRLIKQVTKDPESSAHAAASLSANSGRYNTRGGAGTVPDGR
jgi:pilus assembly protein CpaC